MIASPTGISVKTATERPKTRAPARIATRTSSQQPIAISRIPAAHTYARAVESEAAMPYMLAANPGIARAVPPTTNRDIPISATAAMLRDGFVTSACPILCLPMETFRASRDRLNALGVTRRLCCGSWARHHTVRPKDAEIYQSCDNGHEDHGGVVNDYLKGERTTFQLVMTTSPLKFSNETTKFSRPAVTACRNELTLRIACPK